MGKTLDNVYKHQSLVYKYFLYVVSVALIVFFFPKGGKFKYEFQKGKPWQYENLYAPIDFSIQKTQEEIQEEQSSIRANKTDYYTYNASLISDVKQEVREGLNALLQSGNYTSSERQSLRNASEEVIDEICKVAREKDCKLHMDGARLFNAIVASNTEPARMVRDFDSVSVCLSKGLGAPIGSVLVGSKKDLAQAHRWRKMFGGGMRQAGMMAAAGIYALENNIDRLREDHRRARQFAEALVDMPNFSVNLEAVQSNIVYIGVGKGQSKRTIEELAKHDIDILDTDDSTIRAVFHLHITDEDLEKAIEVFAQIR